MKLLRQPALHFLLIGLSLFIYQQIQAQRATYEIAALDVETRQRIHDDFVRMAGRLPNESQIAALEAQEMESRILFAEALRRNYHRDDVVVLRRLLRDAEFLGIEGSDEEKIRAAIELGVHESDEVIRRRMIQRMERVGRSGTLESPPDAALQKIYKAESERWKVPTRYSFEHRFFSADRPESPHPRASHALAELQAGEASTAGDPFLHGRTFSEQSLRDMTAMFGSQFSDAIHVEMQAPLQLGAWVGPVPSAYGEHLLKISAISKGRTRSFEEVRPRLVQLWREQRERELLSGYIARLRESYVVVEEES